MPSAGLSGLYAASPLSRNITYHDIHNTDIKKLVSILRDFPVDPRTNAKYWQDVKKGVRELPYHLRSSGLDFTNPESKDGKVKSGKLCSGHCGLNSGLVYSIWSSLRFEFERGLGRFLYPLIMDAGLPAAQEWKLRQLEPVLEMWRTDFSLCQNTPADREPIRPMETVNGVAKSKWRLQENNCPGCMLARIGTDKDVLFALLAAMVGRYSSRNAGAKDNVKSRRIRWVRYWLKKFPDGDKLVDQAWDFGEEMRRVRRAWKEHARGRVSGFYGRTGEQRSNSMSALSKYHPGFDFQDPSNMAANSRRRVSQLTVSDTGVDIPEPYTARYSTDGNSYDRSANPTPNQARQPGYARRPSSPYNPDTHNPLQELRRTQSQSRAPSMCSHRASIANTADYSWGSSVSSLRPEQRDSLMPEPLRSHDRRRPPVPNANQRSVYAVGDSSRRCDTRITQWGDLY